MKNVLYLCLFLIGLSSCSPTPYTIIRNVDVFDGKEVWKDVDFIFTDSSIVEISTKKGKYKPSNEIDGQGKTIIPPMINAHVHVRSSDDLKEALEVGIFGMLDMFSTDRRANSLRAYNDSLHYAKFYSSNVGATVPGGHGTQFRVQIPTINDTLSAQEFIQNRVTKGADYIKISQEFSMAKLSASQLKAIIDETHKQGKIAVAHISKLENGLELIEQNVDGLAHIWYRHASIAKEEDLELIKQKNTFVIPTLSVIEKVIHQGKEMDWEERFLSFSELMEEVRKLNDKGIPILAGTDSPNFQMNYTTQYFEELILLKKAGLTNIEVLKSATTNIYKAFKMIEYKKLETDTLPNFMLIDGKPHVDIEAIKNAKRIWKNGVELSS